MLVAGVTLSILAVSRYLDVLDYYFIVLILGGAILNYVLHEFAHKYLAKRYGLFAEYGIIREGAIFTALGIIPFFPFKFIAPGAVFVRGSSNPEETGRIALAGPFTNLILSGIFLTLSGLGERIETFLDPSISFQLSISFYFLALISSTIAMFNLIPFGPLDGSSILKWDKNIFIVTFVFALTSWLLVYSIR